jgi:hypothetical protein
MTNFPNGVASFGIPVVPSSAGLTTGQVFFVSNNWFTAITTGVRGSDSNAGTSSRRPLATLAAALVLCRAGFGDTIFLMPGHVEIVTAAAGILVSLSGIRLIGIGTGQNRPQIQYTTAAAASFNVTGANFYCENIYFAPYGVASVTAAVNVQAADANFVSCEFELANATNGAVLGILTTAAASRLRVKNCYFHGNATPATTVAAICLVGGDSISIEENIFECTFTLGVGAIQNITTACTNLVIKGNLINNLTASSTKCIVAISTTTGQVSRNYMQILSGTAPITGAALSWVGGNYYAAAIATAGTLI